MFVKSSVMTDRLHFDLVGDRAVGCRPCDTTFPGCGVFGLPWEARICVAFWETLPSPQRFPPLMPAVGIGPPPL